MKEKQEVENETTKGQMLDTGITYTGRNKHFNKA
jgi:hypothetical protein